MRCHGTDPVMSGRMRPQTSERYLRYGLQGYVMRIGGDRGSRCLQPTYPSHKEVAFIVPT